MEVQQGKNRSSYRGFTLLCILLLSSCTLKLEDRMAPSLQVDLETEYELVSWGREKVGFAPTPPEIKASGDTITGGGLRIRGLVSNTFTWTNPEGSLDWDVTLDGTQFKGNEPLEAHGWGYRGRLLLMPGFSILGDRLFLAGLVGLDGTYLELDIERKDTGDHSDGGIGRLGVPLGFHVDCTIARTVTPSITYAYVPSISTWSGGLSGHDTYFQLALRLWPGSLFPAMGEHLWIEGGWLWTSSEGPSFMMNYGIEISGPCLGFGVRF